MVVDPSTLDAIKTIITFIAGICGGTAGAVAVNKRAANRNAEQQTGNGNISGGRSDRASIHHLEGKIDTLSTSFTGQLDKLHRDMVDRSHSAREDMNRILLKTSVEGAKLEGRLDRTEEDIAEMKKTLSSQYATIDKKLNTLSRNSNRHRASDSSESGEYDGG